MSLRESKDIRESLEPIPDWLTTLIPALKEIAEINMLPLTVIAELETAYLKMKKDEHDIQEMATAGISPTLTWSDHLARVTFAYAYCKNFRLRITMREHEIYRSSRAANQKLNITFKDRDCAGHLIDQTWDGFYHDIDEALLVTKANITRALIDTSLNGVNGARTQANEKLNIQMVGAVIYLRLLGYAYYPDLTL